MPDTTMAVNLCGVTLKNPVIAASGTFGYGMEYNEFYPVSVSAGFPARGRRSGSGRAIMPRGLRRRPPVC